MNHTWAIKCINGQQRALIITTFCNWHGAWMEKEIICSSQLKVIHLMNVLWNIPFSSLFPKHVKGDNRLLPFPLLLSGFYINSSVGTFTVTWNSQMGPQNDNIKKISPNLSKFSFSSFCFSIFLTQLLPRYNFFDFFVIPRLRALYFLSELAISWHHFLLFFISVCKVCHL